MADPPSEGQGRSSHVRFADQEYSARPRRPHRQDSRTQSRRGTYERVEIPTERSRFRNDSGDRPGPSATFRGDVIMVGASRRSRDEADVYDDYEWPPPDASPRRQYESTRRFTESPRPIEDEEDTRRDARRRRSYSRSRSRSRSPSRRIYGSPPRRDRYRSRETSRTPGYDADNFRSYRAGSFSSDEWDPYDKFSFASQSLSMTESSRDGDSDAETPEPEEQPPPKVEAASASSSQLTLVHSSLYTGNAEMSGSHTATLKVVHDSTVQKHPLFRWLHIPQDVMNFDKFWVEISRVSGLTALEKKAITRLRADVKKTCAKSRINPKGARVGYLDPKSIEVPLKTLKQGTTTADLVTGSARWICIPYFSLEQYSGLLAASNTSLFPPQTLLQTQYSQITEPRDMEQAVCRLGNADRGECFHISQLWCLVIDNSLLVTCGTMSRDDLLGQALEIKEQPSRALATEAKGRILVAYGESVVWLLEAEECQTWFMFLSNFQAFWPKIPEFWHKDQMITAETWPKILKLASTARSLSIKIIMKLGSPPNPPPRSILRPEPQIIPNSSGKKGKPKTNNFFHVLTLASRGLTTMAGSATLEAQLEAAEKFITAETTYSNRKTYKSCKESTKMECYLYLAGLADRVEAQGSDQVRRAYEEKIDIFNAADVIYNFFLPENFEGPMAGKFWGALRTMIELSILEPGFIQSSLDDTLNDVRTSLRNFTQDLFAFQTIMAYSTEDDRVGVDLPPEFSTAWLYVVMGMIYGSKDDFTWNSRINRAKDLVEKGSKKLLQGLSNKSLLDRASVLPLEVLSLVTMGLLQDQVGKSDDICDTYSQYLNSLDNSITSQPSDRSLQRYIDLVQQELVAVKRTLWKQKNIICRVRNSLTAIDTQDIVIRQLEQSMFMKDKEKQYNKRYYAEVSPQAPPNPPPQSYGPEEDYAPRVEYAYTQEVTPPQPANDYMGLDDDFLYDITTSSKLSPTDAGGLRALLFLECSRLIEQREFEFRRFTEFTKDLERGFAYKMDFTRDRQERAIYAFTLVTIIFLPISAVSSIFGMNTTDIRDMEYSQWLYWVVAIPLTVVVILAGLLFMGELGNLARWFLRRSGQGGQGMYGGPSMMSQTAESAAFWPPPPPPPPREEYASPYEAGPGMQRTQTQIYYRAPSTRVVHPSRRVVGY
ncbi:hypothetical protein NCS57_00076100 [Fusarium keratoplasticum]|uniref:Uncharacterized protein n=1 Tax=Fusarium keratoplasticum TaxID=1328300 RepID=A0ACC0RDS0_9HYPO|nr:hypothetical protein NCS57_00076100 [Fusarium keratoplasticum]KAI8684106.1 hypothetical protein NCS57_00076100 [Fusarium keratoplasticum]KAI8688219.1 hypothetical protein NCS55_00075200 [Fusarium keratoplasticum]